MKHLSLHVRDDVAGVFFVPVPVQTLGHRAELDQEIAGQVRRFDFAPFLFPQVI